MTNLDSVLNNRDIALLIKVHIVKTMVFQQSCMDVRFGLQRKLSGRIGAFKLWCLERSLESPLDCKEIKPVNPKENQP